jgi:hypothetical protein
MPMNERRGAFCAARADRARQRRVGQLVERCATQRGEHALDLVGAGADVSFGEGRDGGVFGAHASRRQWAVWVRKLS